MITKRQLGIGFVAMGLLGIVAILAIDLFRAGEFSGIGPLQSAALLGSVSAILVGLTLLPFGDRPA